MEVVNKTILNAGAEHPIVQFSVQTPSAGGATTFLSVIGNGERFVVEAFDRFCHDAVVEISRETAKQLGQWLTAESGAWSE
jgi:UTP-glucose-1-phosphate uridylyltransferase